MQLIQADSRLEEISELIFNQGISTAKAVSQISGRGIDMDAVRQFIEAEAGRVELHLGACLDSLLELYSFHFIISLPNRALA